MHVGPRAVAPLPSGLDVGGQFDEVLEQTEREAATYLVALLLARQACDGIVEGGRRRYDQACVAREARWGEDMGLDARVGGLRRARGRPVEDEDGRIREQLVCGVEQRQVGSGEGGGLLVDYDAHGCLRGCRQCAGTSDGSGLLRGGLGSGQPQWHRAVGVLRCGRECG